MKKIIIAAFMLAAVATTTYATGVKTPAVAISQEDNKTQIDPAQLPDPVKTTLAGAAYKDWKVTSAWQIKADPAYYTIELKKDDKTTTVNIDASGKVK